MTEQQHSNLLISADEAFMMLATELDGILNTVQAYMQRNPNITPSDAIRYEALRDMVTTLAQKPQEMADVILDWKFGREPALSRIGVELEILNEIWATLCSMNEFFSKLPYSQYNHGKAHLAYLNLVRVNRCLPKGTMC